MPDACEFKGSRRDGTLVDLEASVSAATISGNSYIIAAIRDVSERKRLEAQFRQAQKMEAVGQLAGGVAHDFNNLLTAILGYTDLARAHLAPDSEAAKDLDETQRAAVSAANLTGQLLAFSRKQMLQPVTLDVNSVLREIRNMLTRMVGEHIEITLDLADDVHMITADPSQLEQVVMNLVVNARDAMSTGGEVRIATANATVDAANPREMLPPGAYVLLTISDTGAGMTPEVRRHLFEPFFTTKERGKGTGLGLATVYGIVKQSGGWILVDSEVGQGTRFSVYFPATAKTGDSWQPPARPVRRRLVARGQTVLLVEDESLVRQFALRVLEQAGYRVIQAVNGEEALVKLREDPEAVDLVLTDVVMPRMSGRALVDEIAAIRPGVRVLYMSGYTGHTLEEQWFDRSRPLLAKPFTAAGLLAAVNESLSGRLNAGRAGTRMIQPSWVEPPQAAAQRREAAALVHELNNVYAGVLGYVELLLADLAEMDPRRQDVKAIQQAMRRASALAGRLADLAARPEGGAHRAAGNPETP